MLTIPSFFGTHRHTVGKVKHLAGNFLYALVAVTFFSHFDEVGIFRKACRVKENGLAVLVGNGACIPTTTWMWWQPL
jgi:hypothetical protein